MDILFITGLFPKEMEEEIFKKSKGIVEYAANNFQWNILRGVEKYNNQSIKIVNALYIGPFPDLYSDFIIKSSTFKHIDTAKDVNVGFINCRLFRDYSRYKAVFKELKEWSNSKKNDQILLIYGMHTPFLRAAQQIKLFNRNIKICLVIPDLPIFMCSKTNMYYTWRTHQIMKKIYSCLDCVDAYVVLTNNMIDYLGINSVPYIVIEGIINSFPIQNIKKDQNNTKKILFYAGSLCKRYGILNLLQAFIATTNPSFQLWICGTGDAKSLVMDYQNKDNRIKYYGQLRHEKILEMQIEATLLINPRTSEGEYTMYSFPSKTMEYMLSGTPVLMNYLSGIPMEYYPYLKLLKDESIETLTEAIDYTLNQPASELIRFGEIAREFVLKNKDTKEQGRKIYQLLYSLTVTE